MESVVVSNLTATQNGYGVVVTGTVMSNVATTTGTLLVPLYHNQNLVGCKVITNPSFVDQGNGTYTYQINESFQDVILNQDYFSKSFMWQNKTTMKPITNSLTSNTVNVQSMSTR